MTKYERNLNREELEFKDQHDRLTAYVSDGDLVFYHGCIDMADMPAFISWFQAIFVDELPKKCEPL